VLQECGIESWRVSNDNQVYSGLNSGWTSGLRHLKRNSESPVLTT
jgi:hypothetical protein